MGGRHPRDRYRRIHSASVWRAYLSIRTEQASRRTAQAHEGSSPARVRIDARGPRRSRRAVFFHRDLESSARLGVLGRRVRPRGLAARSSTLGVGVRHSMAYNPYTPPQAKTDISPSWAVAPRPFAVWLLIAFIV